MKAVVIISIISLITFGSKRQINNPKTADLKRTRVQLIYTAELGVKEKTGDNDGPRVEEYLRHVGLKKGNPWCAAFVCWVFEQADIADPATGWSPDLFPKSKLVWERSREAAGKGVAGRKKGAGREVVSSLPQKGDVFGIWFPDKRRIAHVGFVDSWSEKWLITVEGNTNEAGSREGDGVWRKRRLVASVWQVSDFISR